MSAATPFVDKKLGLHLGWLGGLALGQGVAAWVAQGNPEFSATIMPALTFAAATVGGLVGNRAASAADKNEAARDAWRDLLHNEDLAKGLAAAIQKLTEDFAASTGQKAHRTLAARLAPLAHDGWLAVAKWDRPELAQLADGSIIEAVQAHYTTDNDSALTPELWQAFLLHLLPDEERKGAITIQVTKALANVLHRDLLGAFAMVIKDDLASGGKLYASVSLRFFSSISKDIKGVKGDTKKIKSGLTKAIKDLKQMSKQLASIKSDTARLPSIENKLDTLLNQDRLTAYLSALEAAFKGYEEIGIDDLRRAEDKSPPIWQIFVPPGCTKEHLKPEDMDRAQQCVPSQNPASDLLPLLADETNRRHVILADPGMGKSTLIQWLTAVIAHQESSVPANLKDCIPIPFILRGLVGLMPSEVKHWNWEALTEALFRYQHNEAGDALLKAFEGNHREFRSSVLASPRSFFLIDGLDEIGDPIKRTAIRDAIWQGFKAHPQARWLITSRIIGYEVAEVDVETMALPSEFTPDSSLPFEQIGKALLESNTGLIAKWAPLRVTSVIRNNVGNTGFSSETTLARRRYLAPFDNRRQDAFTSRWFTLRDSSDHSRELLREVRTHDSIRVISRVPNLLCYMAILKRSGKPLPDGRAELYEKIVEAYLESIDKALHLTAKEHGHSCPFSTAQSHALLALLAIYMQRARAAQDLEGADGDILISDHELRSLLSPVVAGYHPVTDADALLTEFLGHIARRSGLLLPRGDAVYGFTHLSFLEYFASCYLGAEFKRLQQRLARKRDAEDEGAEITETELDADFPPSHITYGKEAYAELAADSSWHEVLVFLVENNADAQINLLRWLFPALHTREIKEPELMPLDAAKLAAKLSFDRSLELSPKRRGEWWNRLWQAWMRQQPGYHALMIFSHSWHIAPALLKSSEYRPTVLAALKPHLAGATVIDLSNCTGLGDLTPLQGLGELNTLSLGGCTGLGDVSPLQGLGKLEKLDLSGCTGLGDLSPLQGLSKLKRLDLNGCMSLGDLSQLQGLGKLEVLFLNDCTGISDAQVAALQEKLPNLTIYR